MKPTIQQTEAFQKLFDYYNEHLFSGILNPCILNFSRKKKEVGGFFAPERWEGPDDNGETQTIHEISLNPECLRKDPKELVSILVHEMVHLWQQDNGKPSRSGYHNKEWGAKMKEVGLYPSNTGEEGGKETGQQMTHYVIKDGPFDKFFEDMPKDWLLPFSAKPTFKITKPNNKIKYTCQCGNNVWGKAGLIIRCEDCGHDYLEN